MSYALYGSNMSNATEGGRFVNNEGSDLTLKQKQAGHTITSSATTKATSSINDRYQSNSVDIQQFNT